MNNKKIILTVTLTTIVLFSVGCGTKSDDPAPVTSPEMTLSTEADMPDATSSEIMVPDETVSETTSPGNIASDATSESTLTGTMDIMKSFMFTVVAENGDAYSISLDENNPVNLDGIKQGDSVIVTYTGTMSPVDSFDGTILSVTKK